jgi:uncharacterized protein YqeY
MTLEELQNEMILALKNHDMEAKTTISGLIAQIKKAAIDVYIKGDIPETLVNSELLKAKKQAEESIAGAIAANRQDLLEKYRRQHTLICRFTPVLIEDPVKIAEIIKADYTGLLVKKEMMKWLTARYRGQMDMKVAAQVVDAYLDNLFDNIVSQ